MTQLIEIRTWRLHPGALPTFRDVLVREVLPLLAAHGHDVVAHGGTRHEEESCFLVRAYTDHADLKARQDAFYGSAAWRQGPRERLVAHIDTYLATLLWLGDDAVDDLRRRNAAT